MCGYILLFKMPMFHIHSCFLLNHEQHNIWIRNMRFGIKTELRCESLLSQLLDTCCRAESLSRVRLFATPRTTFRQAPLPTGFSRQEDWSGLPCPPPGDLPNPGPEPGSPALGFPGSSDDKESACSAGDPGSIPGLGRSVGEGNGNTLQCSCLIIPRTELDTT